MRKPALLVSAGLHVAMLLLLLTIAAIHTATQILEPHKTVMPLSIRYYPARPAPPGGTGQRSAEPAPEAPAPRPAPRLFQPRLIAVNDQPRLAVQTVIAEGPGFSTDLAGLGELPGIPGNGGTGLGLAGPPGNRGGRGSGDGDGDGFGEGGAMPPKITRSPQVIYKEEPEYSEDARKAHIQGTVRLYIDVGLDGRATNIRLVRGVGLGLDENAIEAVRKWRFRPALSGDRPVVAPAVVDVGFFLL